MLALSGHAYASTESVVELGDVALVGDATGATLRADLRAKYPGLKWSCRLLANAVQEPSVVTRFAPAAADGAAEVKAAAVGTTRWLAPLKDREVVTLQLNCRDDEHRHRTGANALLFFRWNGKGYDRLDAEAHITSLGHASKDGTTFTLREAPLIEPSGPYAHLAPWENPLIGPDELAYIEAQIAATEADLAVANGALTASAEATPAPPLTGPVPALEPAAGCAATDSDSPAGPWGLLVLAFGVGLVLVRRRRGLALTLAFVATPAAVSGQAHAVEHVAMGYVSFWDTATIYGDLPASNAPGARYKPCTASATGCIPSQGVACCYRGIPQVTVELLDANYNLISSAVTNSAGFFYLTATNWSSQNYRLRVSYRRTGAPAFMSLVRQGGSVWLDDVAVTTLPNLYNVFDNLAVNTAAYPAGIAGDLASMWRSMTNAANTLEAAGDPLLRHTYGSANAYEEIKVFFWDVPSDESGAWCASTIQISYGWARGTVPVHELGHIHHHRAKPCSIDHPTQRMGPPPDYSGGPHDWFDNTEGNVVMEGAADFMNAFAMWDPAVASTSDVFGWMTCATWPQSRSNLNMAVVDVNVALALWEFVDAETANTNPDNSYPYADNHNISIYGVMAGYNWWAYATGQPGQNRTRDENYEVPVTGYCFNSDWCSAGSVCFENQCLIGDPHGENIRDWVYWIAQNRGDSDTTYWWTLASSPCIGTAASPPSWTGGYVTD